MPKNNDEDKKTANVAKHMVFGAIGGAALGSGLSIVMLNPWLDNNITRNFKLLLNKKADFSTNPQDMGSHPDIQDMDHHLNRIELKGDMLGSAALFATAGALAGLYTARKKNRAANEPENPWQDRIKTEKHAPQQAAPER